eukprot:12262284-Alexandrium_andersonii.AAC.1
MSEQLRAAGSPGVPSSENCVEKQPAKCVPTLHGDGDYSAAGGSSRCKGLYGSTTAIAEQGLSAPAMRPSGAASSAPSTGEAI